MNKRIKNTQKTGLQTQNRRCKLKLSCTQKSSNHAVYSQIAVCNAFFANNLCKLPQTPENTWLPARLSDCLQLPYYYVEGDVVNTFPLRRVLQTELVRELVSLPQTPPYTLAGGSESE